VASHTEGGDGIASLTLRKVPSLLPVCNSSLESSGVLSDVPLTPAHGDTASQTSERPCHLHLPDDTLLVQYPTDEAHTHSLSL
jgi:hypothetical protein